MSFSANADKQKRDILDILKISSAEGGSHIKSLFTTEDGVPVPIRYVDKEKTTAMLQTQGYLAAVGTQSDGFWDSITPVSEGIKSEELDDMAEIAEEAVKQADTDLEAVSYEGVEAQSSSGETIHADMTEEERYEILKSKKIDVKAKANVVRLAEAEKKLNFDFENAGILTVNERKKLFKKLGDEFSVFNLYENKDINLSFVFSKGNIKESLNKQKHSYSSYAKMLTCFEDVIGSAIGIEVHNRNKEGYKTDVTLKNVYVLISAFEDGSRIIPVKLEIKEFSDKDNSLYVAVTLDGIKKDEVVTEGDAEIGVTQTARSSIFSISDLFRNINPLDISFLKYIPDAFLNEEQIRAKHKTDAQRNIETDQSSTTSDVVSNRTLLANALEGILQHESEKSGRRNTGRYLHGQIYFSVSHPKKERLSTSKHRKTDELTCLVRGP